MSRDKFQRQMLGKEMQGVRVRKGEGWKQGGTLKADAGLRDARSEGEERGRLEAGKDLRG